LRIKDLVVVVVDAIHLEARKQKYLRYSIQSS
jgi:hypothetical protein